MNDGATADDVWEYQRLRLPSGLSRRGAAVVLSVQAEYGGWELSRVLLYADGTRKVMLRRKRTSGLVPGLSV